MGALGWIHLLKRIKKAGWRIIPLLILAAGLAGPLFHIIRNHPVEYVYFNKASGGLGKAWGRYETDYYYHSLGPAIRWFQKEIINKQPGGETVVASNFPLESYFPDTGNPATVYTPYDRKGEFQWDYGIFTVAYFSPSQVRDDHWPPAGTIHTIKVDGYPVCAIVRRVTHADHEGCTAFKNRDYPGAIDSFEKALEADPYNETAWLYLGWSLRNSGDLTGSSEAAKTLIDIHPESETPRELLIWNHLDSGSFREALRLADELLRMNPKYPPATALRKAALDSLGLRPADQSR
jgi:tetratricopeptide (TPR) repeat protein